MTGAIMRDSLIGMTIALNAIRKGIDMRVYVLIRENLTIGSTSVHSVFKDKDDAEDIISEHDRWKMEPSPFKKCEYLYTIVPMEVK
jgi:hypothetical protein